MLEIAGISLGSAQRDFEATARWGRQNLCIKRRGSGGDLEKARKWLCELDGRVQAIGLGGINLHLGWPGRRFRFRQGYSLAAEVRQTPVADGWGFKQHWEPLVVSNLVERGLIRQGDEVLVASALDRWEPAATLAAFGCRLYLADPLSALGLPLVFTKLWQLQAAAVFTLPFFCRLPIGLLYPGCLSNKRRTWRSEVRVWVGDTHFLRLYRPAIPPRLVLASTLDAEDIAWFRSLGVEWLAAPSPMLEKGRCPGSNLMEAAVAALTGLPPAEIESDSYEQFWKEGHMAPYLEKLN